MARCCATMREAATLLTISIDAIRVGFADTVASRVPSELFSSPACGRESVEGGTQGYRICCAG
jgi:hypothetical protein